MTFLNFKRNRNQIYVKGFPKSQTMSTDGNTQALAARLDQFSLSISKHLTKLFYFKLWDTPN